MDQDNIQMLPEDSVEKPEEVTAEQSAPKKLSRFWLFLGEKSTHRSTSSGVCVCAHTCSESCLTLYNPMEYSLPGILQARILEWGAITSSRGSSQPRG